MKTYIPVPQDMLANAMNNFKIHEAAVREGIREMDVKMRHYGNVVFMPRATAHLNTVESFDVRAVEDQPLEDVLEAMMWYRGNTDWSAFKKKDWQDAMLSLGFNVKA